MSPLPRLHHHDIMTIVVPSIRHIYIYVPYTYRSYVRNVGALKVAELRCSRQQCSVVGWSGRSVAVRVRVRARVREWNFSLFFFSLCKSVRKNFVVARCNNCTKVNMAYNSHYVMMM